MPPPRTAIMVDLLEEHLEELAFLFSRRAIALESHEYTLRELELIDERIEAHLQGLLVAGERLPAQLAPALSGDDSWSVCAAAFALLKSPDKHSAQMVVDLLNRADDKQLPGLGAALRHGPIDHILDELRQAVAAAPPPAAVIAAEALAVHRQLKLPQPRLEQWLTADEPQVRQAAWRIVAWIDRGREGNR